MDLEKRGRTSGTIQSILEGTSASAVQKQSIKQNGVALPLGEAEETARQWRREFLEGIDVLSSGGAVWNEREQTYMFRKEFPPD